MAVGALLSIVTACICVIVQSAIDHSDSVIRGDNADNRICDGGRLFNGTGCEAIYPKPTAKGFITGFPSIMFAFGGVSTFPTIQVDMKQRSTFLISALLGCSSKLFLFSIWLF